MKIRIERECTSIGVPVDGNEVHFGALAFHNSRLSCRGHFVATLVWAIGTTPNDRERCTGAGVHETFPKKYSASVRFGLKTCNPPKLRRIIVARIVPAAK